MCQLLADSMVAALRLEWKWLPDRLPQRRNYCRQSGVDCGFYAAWWMEDEIRAAAGEGYFVNKYPAEMPVREKMCSLFKALQKANDDMLKDLQVQQDLEDIADFEYNEYAAKKAEETGTIMETLEEAAKKRMFAGEYGAGIEHDVEPGDGPLEHWAEQMMANAQLFEAHMKDVERVRLADKGVCSQCRFSAGCRRCWWPKTVRYWRRIECRSDLYEGYSPAAKAAAKGKAKAAGLPVPAAGGPAAKAKGKADGPAAKAKAKK